MVEEQLGPTPEGELIKRVRLSRHPKLTAEAAAKAAGISAVMWGHVERGHRSGGEGKPRQRVTASASTLAHMAHVTGVSPDALSNAGREDAAAILTEILDRERRAEEVPPGVLEVQTQKPPAVVLIPVPPDMPEGDRQELKEWGAKMAEFLNERRRASKDDL